MEKFTKVGEFCPNEACRDYGKLQNGQTQRNIRKFGKTRRGVQLGSTAQGFTLTHSGSPGEKMDISNARNGS
jgi:hypothetical protein